MLKVRIKMKDGNKTEMSERIKKNACMYIVHVITHMILDHNPLLPPPPPPPPFRFRE